MGSHHKDPVAEETNKMISTFLILEFQVTWWHLAPPNPWVQVQE